MQPNSATAQSASLLSRFLQRVASVEPNEVTPVVTSFLLFFFMLGGYFAVRPVRETIGTLLGEKQVSNLWLYTWGFSLLIIPLYGVIVARVRRSIFLPSIYGATALLLVLVGVALRGDTIDPVTGKVFYVFISVLNLFLISMFWSFLLELFTSAQTKRLFGAIAAGGSAGALLGPLLVSELLLNRVGNSGVLFFGAALFVAAIVCQRALLSLWSSPTGTSASTEQQDRPLGGNIFAGVPLVLRSPYLLGIALFVIGISTVNTLLYFEQLRLVAIYFPDTVERTRVFARLDWIVQALTMLSQLLITGQIARRFGVVALVTGVPVAMMIGFLLLAGGFIIYPLPAKDALAGAAPASFAVFWIFAAVFVMRRASEYAFVRPAREMLWSPLDKESKYKAKNTVDVPVYRGADALSAQVSVAVSSSGAGPTGVALLGAGVAMLWGLLGWWLGRRHDRGTVESPAAKTQRDVAPAA